MKKTKKKIETEENKVVKKFIIVLLVVVACVVLIYFITRIFVSKDMFTKEENTTKTTEVEFNYDITILGTAFNRPYDEYYVITYKASADQAKEISGYITNYLSKEDHLKLYFADLDDHLNKGFYDPENVNKKATNAKELKVGDYTLIKFKNGQIAKYIEGVENIKSELE